MSQKIATILKAASDTASYIEMMRMPSENQPMTKYATLKRTEKGPALKETGFTMLSPTQTRNDEIASSIMGYAFSPMVLCLGVVNGMNAQTKSGKVFNYSTSLIALISMGYYIGKHRKYKNAATLVFPKVQK